MPSSAPIRLAFVITELEPGGAERCLVEVATRLDRTRFSPAVYSLWGRPASGKQLLVQKLADAGIPTHFLDLRRPWHYFRGVRSLAGLLRKQEAEVVQTFLFHANVLGARAAQTAGVPHLTGLRVADPRRWRTSLERWATTAASRHVCVSESVADFYRQRSFPSEKLTVIPNGIDASRWCGARPADLGSLGVPPGRRILLFVGRLDEQKGLKWFFFKLPGLLGELPDHDLLLVGEGPQRSLLKTLARRLAIEHRVHFAGWRTDIPEILAAAELLALPSRWEGMPNVVLEAMAARKPVFATRAQGVVELLGDAALEQSAPLDRLDEFCQRLKELVSKPERLQELAARNYERVIQQFSIDFVAGRYSQLFSDLARR
jgi:glycosyltransferase involved in cell wall biosynthesis